MRPMHDTIEAWRRSPDRHCASCHSSERDASKAKSPKLGGASNLGGSPIADTSVLPGQHDRRSVGHAHPPRSIEIDRSRRLGWMVVLLDTNAHQVADLRDVERLGEVADDARPEGDVGIQFVEARD